jgi:hypothetical protein
MNLQLPITDLSINPLPSFGKAIAFGKFLCSHQGTPYI